MRLMLITFVLLASATVGGAREWADATGEYTLEAELVAASDKFAVLQRADHELAAFPREQLSEVDRKYLASTEGAADLARDDGLQIWRLRDGSEIVGRAVDYASRDLTLQRRHGRNYVNDRRLENLPEFYQRMIPQIVAHKEELPRADRRGLRAWLVRQQGRPRTFHVDGIVLEVENGDEYAVPFFLLSDEDAAVVKAGWDEWNAAGRAGDDAGQRELAFLLESLAAARREDEQVRREIALMKLKLQAVEAGVTSLWGVTLWPAAGQGGPPLWVVVPGRDSREATLAAMEQNPGFEAGPVRRVSRRGRR